MNRILHQPGMKEKLLNLIIPSESNLDIEKELDFQQTVKEPKV